MRLLQVSKFVSFHGPTLVIRKIVERKAFLTKPKHQYHVSNKMNIIVVAITKRIEIVTSIQVCDVSWMNFDFEENGENKSFFSKTKPSKSCIPMKRTYLLCPITKRI